MERRPSDEHLDQLLTRAFAGTAATAGVCPAADVLAAYVDGGLDAAEHAQLTQHAASCPRCAQILAIAVEQPTAAPDAPAAAAVGRSRLARWRWLVPIATAATVAGIWIGTRDAIPPMPASAPRQESVPLEPSSAPPQEAKSARIVVAPPAAGTDERPSPGTSAPRIETTPQEPRREATEATESTRDQAPASGAPVPFTAPQPVAAPPLPRPEAIVPAPRAFDELRRGPVSQAPGPGGGAGGGRSSVVGGVVGGVANETVTVTGETPIVDAQSTARQVASIPLWQLRGTLVQRSLDGGRTWTTEFEAPRTVLGGSTPTADAGWFVGARGLIVRRVGSTWSLVTAPASVDVVSVLATDDRAATVTLADGRVFTTADAGVTWTQK